MKKISLVLVMVLGLFVSLTVSPSISQTIPQYGRTKSEPSSPKLAPDIQGQSLGLNQCPGTIKVEPVKIPSELFKCKIEQMRVGDVGYYGATAMIVNVEGRAYLWGFMELEKGAMSLDDGWLKIEKKIDGYYVSLKLGKQKWTGDKTYYWSPYTVTVNYQEKIIDLKEKAKLGTILPVKKILLYRDRGWWKKDQVDEYEEKLPKEIRKP